MLLVSSRVGSVGDCVLTPWHCLSPGCWNLVAPEVGKLFSVFPWPPISALSRPLPMNLIRQNYLNNVSL